MQHFTNGLVNTCYYIFRVRVFCIPTEEIAYRQLVSISYIITGHDNHTKACALRVKTLISFRRHFRSKTKPVHFVTAYAYRRALFHNEIFKPDANNHFFREIVFSHATILFHAESRAILRDSFTATKNEFTVLYSVSFVHSSYITV